MKGQRTSQTLKIHNPSATLCVCMCENKICDNLLFCKFRSADREGLPWTNTAALEPQKTLKHLAGFQRRCHTCPRIKREQRKASTSRDVFAQAQEKPPISLTAATVCALTSHHVLSLQGYALYSCIAFFIHHQVALSLIDFIAPVMESIDVVITQTLF